MEKNPFVIYADFECILMKSLLTDPNAKTKITQKHRVCSYFYMVVFNGEIFHQELFTASTMEESDNLGSKF